MLIRTKIVATVGPASGEVQVLRQLAQAGCDVFRINFSHGSEEQREAFLRNVRQVEEELGEPLAVMADLCGPKIRVGMIHGGSVLLSEGQTLAICREPVEGNAQRISTTLPELVDEARPGERILLNDGKLVFEVEQAEAHQLLCRVRRGGVLASGKGVNLPQTDLTLSALTEKDRRDVRWIAQRGFDFVALSFVRRAEDIQTLRRLLRDSGCDAHIIAKIEKPHAVENIDEILEVTDAVMIARGDLGVEMDLPKVPAVQKRIARKCQRYGKPCIIATQMLETMTDSPTPTRAEVSDVANAMLDQADAVMLSGETAVGRYPARAVAMMNEIVAEMQAYHDELAERVRVEFAPAPTTASLTGAIGGIMQVEDIRAVAAFSVSGTTARILAKNRLPCMVLALSPDMAAVRRMCMYYGVHGRRVTQMPEHTRDVLAMVTELAVELDVAREGDKIIVLSGRPIDQPGTTNTLVVHQVGRAEPRTV